MLKQFFNTLAIVFFSAISVSHAAPLVPSPPEIKASGYLLIDIDSKEVLASKSQEQRLEPASLTKIMTAYVVFREIASGNLKPKDETIVSEKAWKTEGSRMFIEVNKRVPIEALLKGMIIQSGNDASVALAEHIAGSEESFAGLMNEHAKRLGMHNTHFTNATGLPDDNHYTTPHDVAIVAAATIQEFPEFYKLYAVKEYTHNNIRQHNRNNLLWRDKSVDGMKTGHTEAAGYCLVASAKRENMRIIAVVMGTSSAKSRVSETQKLLNYGFRFYETHRLYAANDKLVNSKVWKGDKDVVSLGLVNDLYITIPRRQYDKLAASTEITPQLLAPIQKGQTLGKVIIKLNSELVAERELVALNGVAEGGFMSRMSDSVMMMME